ncbi:uncharacterized protein LOC132338500 isoform X4 [Haemorhous mexicanus]|uniref:uncharacterized protein LOC132338500 isoform X4 n=1 Tax=Haemorhous mexicanus TaxID=30427 RepID=UPI0028BD55DE|nr:uncharacterized protein LOC132338500 isoform X4 [Haemorhous mexicanus]
MWEVLPTLLAPQVPPPAGIHGIPSIPIMLFQSSWAVLLLCTTAGFLGWLGLAAPPKKEELWETWMRSALDETPVAQLMQDIARWMGNVSSCRAAELQGGQLSNLHQEQERPQDIHPQPESILVLQEVMEKLQRVNQSLELMLMALEDAQSRLEKHLEHLKAVPDLDGEWEWGLEDQWELVGTNTRLFFPIPQVRAKVSPPPASHTAHTWCSWFSHWCRCHSGPSFSSSSSLPAPSVFQQSPLSWSLLRQVGTSVGTVAGDTPPWGGRVCPPPPSHSPTGHWLLASACRGARRIRPVVSREKARYRLTSTPERCSILDVPSLEPHPEFPILDVPSWSHLAEVSRKGQDTTWMAFLQLLGFSSPLHILFLVNGTSLGVHPGAIWQRSPGKDRTHPDGFPTAFGHLFSAP